MSIIMDLISCFSKIVEQYCPKSAFLGWVNLFVIRRAVSLLDSSGWISPLEINQEARLAISFLYRMTGISRKNGEK